MKKETCSPANPHRLSMVLAPLLIVLSIFGAGSAHGQADQLDLPVKNPVVAGKFYPADSATLAQEIDGYIDQATVTLPEGERVVALVTPHAGIAYSGRIAGYTYNLVRQLQPKTVVIVGPSHYAFFDGVSVFAPGFFRTPLGLLPVNNKLAEQIAARSKKIRYFPEAYDREHNIEVQFPFLQRTVPGVSVVTLVIGDQSPENVTMLAKVLTKILRENDALLIASTDLSHYKPASRAKVLDDVCIDDMVNLQPRQLLADLRQEKTEMCGGGPAAVVLTVAKALGADQGRVLKYGHSGEVLNKDTSKVVGYVSLALVDTEKQGRSEDSSGEDVMVLSDSQKKRLLNIARESIEYYLAEGRAKQFSNDDPELAVPCGAFVTLKRGGQLRGCIGQVEGRLPLYETVAGCAISAAVRDPRFRPVTTDELPALELEISVLTPPVPVDDVDDIVVGRDGLIIEKGPNRGLLLPQVPVEWGWDRVTFLQHLCQKAGLAPNDWKSGAKILRFEALVFGENEQN